MECFKEHCVSSLKLLRFYVHQYSSQEMWIHGPRTHSVVEVVFTVWVSFPSGCQKYFGRENEKICLTENFSVGFNSW